MTNLENTQSTNIGFVYDHKEHKPSSTALILTKHNNESWRFDYNEVPKHSDSKFGDHQTFGRERQIMQKQHQVELKKQTKTKHLSFLCRPLALKRRKGGGMKLDSLMLSGGSDRLAVDEVALKRLATPIPVKTQANY